MISYDVTCFICRKIYQVTEYMPDYQRVKRNYKGKHCCTPCKEAIERDAKTVTGINREMLEQLDAIGIESSISPGAR